MFFFNEYINELLNAPEGEHFQFKEAKNRFDFSEAVEICCALSNCGGGKLVLGITDKRPRKVVNSNAFLQPERTRENLMDKLGVKVDFQLYEYDSKRVLVFEVARRPIGLPVMVDGVAWWYKGDSLVPMPPEVLHNIYNESGHDFSSDICPSATLQDLDLVAINDFRKRWFGKSGNTSLRNLSVEQLLLDCEAITDNGVTYAALILFGTRAALGKHLSQAEVVFEYRSSEAAGPAQQREDFRIGFFAYYDRVWELINLRNDKQHYQDGLFVLDIPTFNERVVRESILNAVCHRNYQLGGGIFVKQYNNRLVIESPGGFPSGISLDNILFMQSRRNRRIADILALCGLIERSGQGMNLIYELCIREAKALPDFNGTDLYWVCITLNGLVLDKKMVLFIQKIGDDLMEGFITEDFLVVNALYHEHRLPAKLRSRAKRLVGMGIVEHIGRGRYLLARKLYEAIGESGVHTRLVGLDRETNKELLLRHIREQGEMGAPLSELLQVLPGHSKDQVKNLLRELRVGKRIYSAGKANAAKWFLV